MKQTKTNKGKYNAIIKKAESINAKLRKLQEEAQTLADACAIFGDDADYDMYIYKLAYLQQTAEDLASFDFEDSIPEKAKYNF